MPDDVQALINQLSDPKADKRRSAAKKLRKLARSEAGAPLLAALKKEVTEKKLSWETHYHLIMAIGAADYKDAVPYLRELLKETFIDASMQYMALGDTLTRLERTSQHDAVPVLQFLQDCKRHSADERTRMCADGALRAMAMLRMKPDTETICAIISDVTALTESPYDSLPFWVLAAAPGWEGTEVDQFVQTHLSSPRDDVRNAAQAAQSKKYQKWNPL